LSVQHLESKLELTPPVVMTIPRERGPVGIGRWQRERAG
jgi:hypothetical protein